MEHLNRNFINNELKKFFENFPTTPPLPVIPREADPNETIKHIIGELKQIKEVQQLLVEFMKRLAKIVIELIK